MAIRFQCPSCAQPIEVDDDLASRLVACPYCRKTVTAPATSTLSDPSQVPTAAPLAPRGDRPGIGPVGPAAWSARPGQPYAPAASSGNALAVVAFALACVTLLMFFSAVVILGSHSIEYEELMKEMQQAGTSMSEQMKAMTRYVEERGGKVPTWFFAVSALYVGAFATSVVALVCGLVAIRRPPRRGFSIAALIICGLYLVLMCGGMVVGA